VALTELQKLQSRLGRRIKELRAHKKMKQQELASLCNLEKSHMSRIESGGQNLTLKMLLKITTALEIEMSELFNFTRIESKAKSK
jgi:transcriptional regulator with XRE-family HTH domain